MYTIIDFDILCDILTVTKGISSFYYVSAHRRLTVKQPGDRCIDGGDYGFYVDVCTISYYDSSIGIIKKIGDIVLHDTSSGFDYCAVKGRFTSCDYVEFTIHEQPVYYLDHFQDKYRVERLDARIDSDIHDGSGYYDITHLIAPSQQ